MSEYYLSSKYDFNIFVNKEYKGANSYITAILAKKLSNISLIEKERIKNQ